jgi:hypothetical protein
MGTSKRTALLAVIASFAFLPLTPAAAAGPLLIPWAVGHVIGAAARLATLPFVVASAASAGAPPAHAGAPAYYPSAPNYNAVPGSYYGPPVYYRQPGYAPAGYYAAPTPYYLAPHYLAPRYPVAPVYRPAAFTGSWNRYPESHRGYSAPGMRYAGSYGGQVFGGRSRGFSYHR